MWQLCCYDWGVHASVPRRYDVARRVAVCNRETRMSKPFRTACFLCSLLVLSAAEARAATIDYNTVAVADKLVGGFNNSGTAMPRRGSSSLNTWSVKDTTRAHSHTKRSMSEASVRSSRLWAIL